MNSKEIRQKFLDFFRSRQHLIVPSAPLVIKNDPTLMFTNAGMNQFKDYFLGLKEPAQRRIADSQKCLRVSGKHNDLEEVGIDTYHHTLFEMLGNWSFGDYFKKEAIEWAWELLTVVYGLPEERMYVTVFEGDPDLGLEKDLEAARLWLTMVREEKILFGNKKDNFWEMGDTGPCGPCSEIHIDLRTDEEIKKIPGYQLVNTGHPLVIEIWNLVFIQYNRTSKGTLETLPQKHVDTGMGFERLVMAIQRKKSNYDTDVFTPLIRNIENESGIPYGKEEKSDIAMRVIADHIRAISFAVADGQLPSNVKAGYVIRRILRRAVRYGFNYLGFRQPAIYRLVDLLSEQFAEVFPELHLQKDFIKKVIAEEETNFLRTLENGLKRFEQITQQLPAGSGKLDGKTVFELYDTFGFPVDLTALIAREHGLTIDEAGFTGEMEKQKERSKKAAQTEKGDWIRLKEETETEFLGYEHLQANLYITRYREIKNKKDIIYQMVFDRTPFYAESGGQVGDTGYIQQNGERIFITNTKKENDLIIHEANKLPSDPTALFSAVVDEKKRKLTENNHTATHLLHAALRKVLGPHVQQKGSLVNHKILRFDFSHYTRVSQDDLVRIEQIVNEKIREDVHRTELKNVAMEKAKEMGAMALFGEKYGEFVRVISFDPEFSVELCGGTHVPSTGRIGFFKILSEGSVAAGVRRIEAVTASEAENYINQKLDVINELDHILKNPADLVTAVKNLVEEKENLARELEILNHEKLKILKSELLKKIKKQGKINYIIEKISVPDAPSLKDLAFQLRKEVENLFLVLVFELENKPQITIMLSENLLKEYDLNATKMIKDLAREIEGGGGGQPFYATAGGKNREGIDRVLKLAGDLVAGLKV